MIDFNRIVNNKRVLITGADGFMGSHLTERLIKLGAIVSVYVRGNSVNGTHTYQLKNIDHLNKYFDQIITGNIASTDSIKLISANKPDYIFHLAADAYVPNSFDHPKEVMETNMIGTINILESVRLNKSILRVVCTSSSEIYGLTIGKSIDESHQLFPSSPYAASKVAADRYCYSYINTYGLPVSIIRPFNTYGPKHTYDVIPKFIELALQDKDLPIYGDGKQARDFTYIDDMVDAFLLMGLSDDATGKCVNFGTGISHTIIDTANLILKLSKSKSKIVHKEKRKAEVPNLICNYSLAKKLFNWIPKTSFKTGIDLNIKWAKQK